MQKLLLEVRSEVAWNYYRDCAHNRKGVPFMRGSLTVCVTAGFEETGELDDGHARLHTHINSYNNILSNSIEFLNLWKKARGLTWKQERRKWKGGSIVSRDGDDNNYIKLFRLN